jgi:hypothetical protein
MAKITIELSQKAEKYFNEVQYSLPKNPDGTGIATISQCVNECLETLADFEQLTENQLANWLDDYKKLKGKAKNFAADPTIKKPINIE